MTGKIDISAVEESSIARVPSPVIFKVLPKAIYILPQEEKCGIAGKEFEFSKGSTKRIIKVPESFNLIDFLDGFMEDFNDKKSKKGGDYGLIDAKDRSMNNIKQETFKITEVKPEIN